jgi:hypothetical protein
MSIRISCLLVLTALLTGCWQKSVHPFYTAGDAVAEPKLAGSWQVVKDNGEIDETTWTFTRSDDKSFELVGREKEEAHEYDARVFKLGDRRYLNLMSRTRALSTVPAHHLFQVIEVGSELKVKALNENWMRRWLGKHPGSLAHIVIVNPAHRDDREKDEIILTADTKALQSFIRDHIKDDDFFTGEIVLKKQSSAATAGEKK